MDGSFDTRIHRMGDVGTERLADRLEALCSLSYLMRADISSRERLEKYLQLMDHVLAGMAADEKTRRDSAA